MVSNCTHSPLGDLQSIPFSWGLRGLQTRNLVNLVQTIISHSFLATEPEFGGNPWIHVAGLMFPGHVSGTGPLSLQNHFSTKQAQFFLSRGVIYCVHWSLLGFPTLDTPLGSGAHSARLPGQPTSDSSSGCHQEGQGGGFAGPPELGIDKTNKAFSASMAHSPCITSLPTNVLPDS